MRCRRPSPRIRVRSGAAGCAWSQLGDALRSERPAEVVLAGPGQQNRCGRTVVSERRRDKCVRARPFPVRFAPFLNRTGPDGQHQRPRREPQSHRHSNRFEECEFQRRTRASMYAAADFALDEQRISAPVNNDFPASWIGTHRHGWHRCRHSLVSPSQNLYREESLAPPAGGC